MEKSKENINESEMKVDESETKVDESKENDSESKENDSESKENDSEPKENDSESKENDSESKENDDESKENDDESKENIGKSGDSISKNESLSKDIEARKVYKAILEKNKTLMQENRLLQAMLALYFADSELYLDDKLSLITGTKLEERYSNVLNDIENIQKETANFTERLQEEIDENEKLRHEKEKQLKEYYKEIYDLKKHIAQRAVNSATGEHLSTAKIEFYLRKENEIDEGIRQARFESVKEKALLEKEESRKAELSQTGQSTKLQDYKLTVFDTQFQSNNADTRKEELEATKAKCWEIVNTINHLKLKLIYLNNDKICAKEKLAEIDKTVSKMTQGMLALKSEHETKVRQKMRELKKKYALLHDSDLPQDYKQLLQNNEELTRELEELKKKYQHLSSIIKRQSK